MQLGCFNLTFINCSLLLDLYSIFTFPLKQAGIKSRQIGALFLYLISLKITPCERVFRRNLKPVSMITFKAPSCSDLYSSLILNQTLNQSLNLSESFFCLRRNKYNTILWVDQVFNPAVTSFSSALTCLLLHATVPLEDFISPGTWVLIDIWWML